MSTPGFTRRAVIAACGAFALVIAVGGQNALAQSGLAVRNIRVDVSPLRASAGDPTATWVEQELPRRLAQALAGRLTPKGGTLVVRIDTLTLGPNSGATIHGGSSPDNIGGVAMIGGRRVAGAGDIDLLRFADRPDDDRSIQSLPRVATRPGAGLLAVQRPLRPQPISRSDPESQIRAGGDGFCSAATSGRGLRLTPQLGRARGPRRARARASPLARAAWLCRIR